ncbi:MAG: hypothetical protein ACE5J4_02030 [Candidatus Aenigmatarchaeota archaeon]
MNWKEFFKPTKWKLLLIFILIIFSFIFIYINFSELSTLKCKDLPEHEYRGERGDVNPKLECHIEVAIDQKNPYICNNLEKEYHKNICYTEVATKLNDSSVCENVNGYYDSTTYYIDFCYWEIATFNKDISVCEKITTDSISSWNRFRCYWELAKIMNNTTFCDTLQNIKDITNCYNDVESFNKR